MFATYEGAFPFWDLLTKFEPDQVVDGARAYCTVKNPDIQVDKTVHFAMGIFWKAAVHSWKGRETEPMIQLGPYAESVRTFLRGETLWFEGEYPERR
jgi:hypothetical protein